MPHNLHFWEPNRKQLLFAFEALSFLVLTVEKEGKATVSETGRFCDFISVLCTFCCVHFEHCQISILCLKLLGNIFRVVKMGEF